MLLVLGACAKTTVFVPSISCSSLVPKTWNSPVDDAPAPKEGTTVLDTLKSWIQFGTAQTANKRIEYDRATQTKAIIRQCEDRWNASIKKK